MKRWTRTGKIQNASIHLVTIFFEAQHAIFSRFSQIFIKSQVKQKISAHTLHGSFFSPVYEFSTKF